MRRFYFQLSLEKIDEGKPLFTTNNSNQKASKEVG